MQSSTRTPGTQGAQASTRQDSRDTAERHDQLQETGKEMREQAQELMAQGKEVAAEYYEEGATKSSPCNSNLRTRCGRNLSSRF